MTISKRLEKHLRCEVDFGEFYLLDVIAGKHKQPVASLIVSHVLLAPRKPETANAFFGMKIKGNGQWYGSLEHLLGTCVNVGYMSKLRAKLLTRRYKAMRARDAA